MSTHQFSNFYHLILNFETKTILSAKLHLTPTRSPNYDNYRPLHPDMDYLTFPDDAPIVIGCLSYEKF